MPQAVNVATCAYWTNTYIAQTKGTVYCADGSGAGYAYDAIYPTVVSGVLLTQSEYDSLTSSASWLQSNQAALINVLNNQSTLASQSFDPATAGEFYAWGFVGVFLVAFASWGAGEILGFIKHVLEIRS
jgi:hypothetical protein